MHLTSKYSSVASSLFLFVTVVSPFELHLPEAGDSVFHSSGSPWWVAYTEWGDILTQCLFTDLPLVYSQISQKEPYCALNRNTEVPILLQRSPLTKRFMAASSIWNIATKQNLGGGKYGKEIKTILTKVMDFVPWDEPQVTKKGQRVSGF